MLYIFRVDTGCMINLEMSLALETVTHLRNAVAATWGIPQDKQVYFSLCISCILYFVFAGFAHLRRRVSGAG